MKQKMYAFIISFNFALPTMFIKKNNAVNSYNFFTKIEMYLFNF